MEERSTANSIAEALLRLSMLRMTHTGTSRRAKRGERRSLSSKVKGFANHVKDTFSLGNRKTLKDFNQECDSKGFACCTCTPSNELKLQPFPLEIGDRLNPLPA